MATPQTQMSKGPGTSTPTSTLNPGEMACPDPSAHVHAAHEKHLQEQASTAALYVTNPSLNKPTTMKQDDGMSAASAAASLKYAKPQDLPSYPVSGSVTLSSAGAAASLAHANQKPFEHWTPEASSNAGKAALLVKDNKPPPTWEPQASSAGSKAALLAHRNSMKKVAAAAEAKAASESDAASAAALRTPRRPVRTTDRPEPSGLEGGSSAAGAAMRTKSRSPPTEVENRADQQRKALLAATGAFSNTTRRRAGSTPVPAPAYPDAANSGRNALNAATISHRSSVKAPKSSQPLSPVKGGPSSPALEAARIQNIGAHVPKEMWGDAPPLRMEVEEKKHKEALRGASISMARNLYDVQAKMTEERANSLSRSKTVGHAAATSSALGRTESDTSKDLKAEALRYLHVQDAAQKLAAERLSKIMPDEETAFRQYYGYGSPTRRSRLSRFSHRRASSEGSMGGGDSDDEEQSRRIRSQMTKFNAQVALIDEKKRTKDRQSLMAAAERLVHAQMHNMDEKVFNETGKVPPALMEEWEHKAQERAAADSEARLQNHGKVHIGGGKFLTQEEIDAVATSKIQPTLDEISDQAEKQRARDEEIRLDQEEKKRQMQVGKDRDAELKAEQKRQKEAEKLEERQKREEEKAAQKQEKDDKKAEKDAEKVRKAEEKRLQREEQRKSKESRKSYINHENTTTTQGTDDSGLTATRTEYSVGVSAEQPSDATSPTSPNRFSRFMGKFKRRTKSTPASEGGQDDANDDDDGRRSPSISSLSSSDDEADGARGRNESRVSGSGVSADRDEERDTFDERLMPAPNFASENKESSPARGGKFHEEL